MILCEDEIIIENVKKYLYQALKDKMKFKVYMYKSEFYKMHSETTICLTVTDNLRIEVVSFIGTTILPELRSPNILSLEKIVDEYFFNIDDFKELIENVRLVEKMRKSL